MVLVVLDTPVVVVLGLVASVIVVVAVVLVSGLDVVIVTVVSTGLAVVCVPLQGGRASTTMFSSMLECTWQYTVYMPMMSNVCLYEDPAGRIVESKASVYTPSAVHVPLLVALCGRPSHVKITVSPDAIVSVTLDTLVDQAIGHAAGCDTQGVVDVKSVGLGVVCVDD